MELAPTAPGNASAAHKTVAVTAQNAFAEAVMNLSGPADLFPRLAKILFHPAMISSSPGLLYGRLTGIHIAPNKPAKAGP